MDKSESIIHGVIDTIIQCTGEPHSSSSRVIELLSAYLKFCTKSILIQLPNYAPTLPGLLHIHQNKQLYLLRILNYFKITSTGYEMQSKENHEYTDFDPDNGSKRVLSFCGRLGVQISPTDCTIPEKYKPLITGRRLRLSRIDHRFAQAPLEEYLAFTKQRQSATFLVLPKRHLSIKRWQWLSYLSGISIETELGESHVVDIFSQPEVREGIRVLLHLLTGHVQDVIDLTLFNRTRLNIDLSSPLTPFEVEQAIAQLKSKWL